MMNKMSDPIDRQAAINAFAEYIYDVNKLIGARRLSVHECENIASRVLKKLPSAQPKAIPPKFVAEDRYIKNHFSTYPHCPKCNYTLETGDCYCKVCGCHIDWNEDEDIPMEYFENGGV